MEKSSCEANCALSQSQNSPLFMDHEGSLQWPQEPATGPCPEPDGSSPFCLTYSTLIVSSHLCLGLPTDLSSSSFPTKNF